MASKGQKFKKYSKSFKKKILEEYFNGQNGAKNLAKKYNLSYKTIENWIAKSKKGTDITIDHKIGTAGKFTKKKNLTLEDYKERYEILKKYRVFLQARRGKK